MTEFEFPLSFIERFRAFLSSDCYKDIDIYSKSEYWKDQAGAVSINISGNKIKAKGVSGFYIPPQKGMARRIKTKILKYAKEPFLLRQYIKEKFWFSKSKIRLLSYFEAFDEVMTQGLETDPVLSPYRINFKKMRQKPGIISSLEEIQKSYFAKDKYEVSPQIIVAYYFYNILHSYIDMSQVRTILEIGAGNGNLLSLLYKLGNKTTIVDVDLPETLSHAILYITDLFPEAKILLPNEIGPATNDLNCFDFIFLTPKQIHLLKDRFFDLAINIDSFQEMTHGQIEEYFQLIQRCGKDGSHFFTANRVEKISHRRDSYQKEIFEPPNRFSDFPWNPANKILIWEICQLTRLCQLNNTYIRLEQIKNSI